MPGMLQYGSLPFDNFLTREQDLRFVLPVGAISNQEYAIPFSG